MTSRPQPTRDIADATGSTYTVTAQNEGKAIKVRVTFIDEAGKRGVR